MILECLTLLFDRTLVQIQMQNEKDVVEDGVVSDVDDHGA
jgi:hypothetical protein